MKKRVGLMTVVVVLSVCYSFGETVGWRGNGSGVFSSASVPTEWNDSVNVAWTASVGYGYSSPIVLKDKIIVISEPSTVTCLNAKDGKVLWTKEISPKDLPAALQANVRDFFGPGTSGNAALAPLSDGNRVFIVLGNGIVLCLDLATGKCDWGQHIDTQPQSMEGRSASPVLAGGKLLVHLTNLVALDPATGKILWQQAEAPDAYGSLVAGKIGTVDIVVTPMGDIVRVSDGKILASGIGEARFSSPVIQDDVVVIAGYSITVVKLPAQITGDKVTTAKVWEGDAEGEVYSSPLFMDNLLYVLTNDGVLTVYDTKTKTKKALDLKFSGDIYPSIVAAGKHLVLAANNGSMAVVTQGKEPKLVRANQLSSGSGSTLTVSSDSLYVRSADSLLCIRETPKAGPAPAAPKK